MIKVNLRMQLQTVKQKRNLLLIAKAAAVLLFLFLTVGIVACGSGTGQNVPAAPAATVTISFNGNNGSPTPPLKDYYCGGWATDATTAFNVNGVVNVYGKLTHLVDGNPVGVGNATAIATILWPDSTTQTMSATTTSDGLAVFSIMLKPSALNHIVLIQIVFTFADTHGAPKTCSIPQAAFFTAILASPTPSATAQPSPTGSSTASPTPGGSPTPIGSVTPTPTGSPTPTKSPTPGH